MRIRQKIQKMLRPQLIRGRPITLTQNADRVHQLLQRNRRVIDLTSFNETVEHFRRTVLQLVDIDAGIEQQPLSGDPLFVQERQLIIAAAG